MIKKFLRLVELGRVKYHISHNFIPLTLLAFSLWDLRHEIQLLLDHFTFTSLIFALQNKTLAVIIMFSIPSIWRHYAPSKRTFEGK